MKHRSLILLGISLFLLSGCATILGSKQKDLPLVSDPAGADVYLDGNRVGSTPITVKIDNMKAHVVVFKKEGYKEVSCQLNRATGGGWVIFDVLTGLVPIVIDAATGNWSQVKEKDCTVKLER